VNEFSVGSEQRRDTSLPQASSNMMEYITSTAVCRQEEVCSRREKGE
jgi:hypothetical protein